jgi:hypothetical protein
VKLYTFLRKHATGVATTELHIVHVERGMSWEEVMDRYGELTGSREGFYLSHQVWNTINNISEIFCLTYSFLN